MTFASRWFALAAVVAASASVFVSVSLRAQPAPPPIAASSPNAAAADAQPPAGPAAPAAHVPQTTWSSVRVKDNCIAMTFDDGPSATLTPKLLDLLKERNIHVTFFVIGENAKAHPEILRRAIAEGHEIGNHSWNHPDLKKMSEADVRSQLDRTKEAITAAIGKAPIYMRPPYGSLSTEQRKWVHDDLGYKIILWTVDPFDWKRPGPDVVHKRIVDETHKGSIILSHDIHPGTVEAMPGTLDDLAGKGFKFVTVSELLAMELPPEPKPASTPKPAGAAGAAAKPKMAAKPASTPRANLPDKITGAPDAPQ